MQNNKFQRSITSVPGVKNVIRSSLYDFQTYAAAGQSSLTFFQVPIGQSGKTKADTNMEQAGSLPAGKSFLIETLELYFFPGSRIDVAASTATNLATQADDLYQFAQNGFLELFIGSTTFLTEAPLGRFPSSTGLTVQNALAATLTAPAMFKSSYAQTSGLLYRIQPELTLRSTENFNVSLNWPALIANPSGVAARIGVVMRGQLQRNAQ